MSRGIKYSKEFKLGALGMFREGRNIREVSESLGVRRETISVWKNSIILVILQLYAKSQIVLLRFSFKKLQLFVGKRPILR
nr:transposase [Elizabethkingia sp. ASV34]